MKLYTRFIIIILRLLSALPFAVYYSSLQLYLLSAHFKPDVSTSLVGSVLALSFGSSLIGGMLAGRYISYRAFFIFSMICQAIGCLTFTTLDHQAILWFSSFFLLGSAGITVSINMMITQRYESQDSSREKIFFWLYMALNLGYLLGYSLSGYYGNVNAYHHIPTFILFSSAIAIILALLHWRAIDKKNNYGVLNFYLFLLISAGLFFVIRLLLQFSQETNVVIIIAWLVISLIMLFVLIKNFINQKEEILVFYILLLSSLVFWSVYFLAPMALIVFIKQHVNLRVSNFLIAPQWIQNINTIVIIAGTIFLGSKTKLISFNTRSIITQFSVGLLSIGLGFGLLALGIFFTKMPAKIMLVWVIFSYILQSIGELLIGPIGYALIGRLIPKSHHSIMMGIWITLLGVAGAVASKLSALMPYSSDHSAFVLTNYEHFFLSLCLIVIVIAGLIYFISQTIIKRTSLR